MAAPARTTVIIGGVAGGMYAATRLRRNDEQAAIVVLERGEHVSFANCGLQYVIGGAIEERDDILLQTPASLGARFGLDVRARSEVAEIDRLGRRVRVRTEHSEYWLHWDNLVISTGATPVLPEIPGADRALALRDVADMDRIAHAAASAASAVVIGGGFIGLEVVDNLLERGIAVTLVQRGAHLMPSLDPEMAWPLAESLRARGVDIRFATTATRISADSVELSDGTRVPSDVTIVAVGVSPESGLGARAGLDLGPHGGILVDDQLRTSDPSIWAVGDVIEKRSDLYAGSRGDVVTIPLAGLANRHGRLVADAIVGRSIDVAPAIGTSIIGVGGVVAASVGRTEASLLADGRAIRVVHAHPKSHAGYYPGARRLSMKLIVDPASDAILGAQAVGTDGVDKRIDVIATAIAGGVRASQLADLELAYAPQFGSAKDAVNILGYVASNARDGEESVQWHELDARLDEGWMLLDVRTADENDDGFIPGAINVPLDELRGHVHELGAVPVIVHCAVGQRGHTAAAILRQHGVRAANLDGGYVTWRCGMAATFERELAMPAQAVIGAPQRSNASGSPVVAGPDTVES